MKTVFGFHFGETSNENRGRFLKFIMDIEDPNKTNNWKNTNNYEGKLVIAYNTNAETNTLHSRTLYALYMKPNDNSDGHLKLKLSTNQILLVTMTYQPKTCN